MKKIELGFGTFIFEDIETGIEFDCVRYDHGAWGLWNRDTKNKEGVFESVSDAYKAALELVNTFKEA